MSKRLNELKKHLKPGMVYRRADLEKWSNAVDRHLKKMQQEGLLVKLSAGVYYYPKETSFGKMPAKDENLIKSFLKDDRFLITTPNLYNMLGLGTTQLYNNIVVYNHKRHGLFKLGNRLFDFRMKPYFPKKISKEFLLVDMVNNLDLLVEDVEEILGKIKNKVLEMNNKVIVCLVKDYGNVRTKKFFNNLLEESSA